MGYMETLYYLHNFSINLKLLENKVHLKIGIKITVDKTKKVSL